MEPLLDDVFYDGPQMFSRRRLARTRDLFERRAALFCTPTENIPAEYVGSGPLDITLPLVAPSIFEYFEVSGYRSARLWVDLIQRATGKIRWTPIGQVRITIIRYDTCLFGPGNISGTKALVDALKVKSTGRRDGRWLYLFGAVEDDNQKWVKDISWNQERVAKPTEGHCRVVVKPANDGE